MYHNTDTTESHNTIEFSYIINFSRYCKNEENEKYQIDKNLKNTAQVKYKRVKLKLGFYFSVALLLSTVTWAGDTKPTQREDLVRQFVRRCGTRFCISYPRSLLQIITQFYNSDPVCTLATCRCTSETRTIVRGHFRLPLHSTCCFFTYLPFKGATFSCLILLVSSSDLTERQHRGVWKSQNVV